MAVQRNLPVVVKVDRGILRLRIRRERHGVNTTSRVSGERARGRGSTRQVQNPRHTIGLRSVFRDGSVEVEVIVPVVPRLMPRPQIVLGGVEERQLAAVILGFGSPCLTPGPNVCHPTPQR